MNLAAYKDQITLHFIVFIWGFTGVLGKLISIEGSALAWIRMGIAFFSLFLYMLAKKMTFKASPKEVFAMLGVGLIIAVHWATFFIAIKVSTVSVALVCMSSSALFMSFLEPIILKRKIIGYEMLFGAVVIVALLFIFKMETQYAVGIGLALFSAFLAALFTAINAIFIKKHTATKITTYEMLGGFLGLGLFMVLSGDLNGNWIPTTQDWMYLLLLGVVCTAFAFVASVAVMKSVSPFTVAISVNLEPIYAIIMALLIFKEEEYMSTGFYLGAAVLILTIFANGYLKVREKRMNIENAPTKILQ